MAVSKSKSRPALWTPSGQLARLFRPRNLKPLQKLIAELAQRQEYNDKLQLNPHSEADSHPSITYSGLQNKLGLTERQLKDGLTDLRKARYIVWRGQHDGKRKGFGRSFWDCSQLLIELNKIQALATRLEAPAPANISTDAAAAPVTVGNAVHTSLDNLAAAQRLFPGSMSPRRSY